MTEVDSNPCAGEQRECCYLSGQVLDSHGDVNPALKEMCDNPRQSTATNSVH